MQALSRLFTVALITTFLFSFFLTIYTRITNTEQTLEFNTTILTFVVLSAPMFLIVGVITSVIFEKLIRSSKIKWFSYVIVGAVLIIPYTLYLFPGADLMRFSLLGAFGAFLYCMIQAVFNRYIFKKGK